MSVNFDDKPITKLEDDLLGHNKFAEDIATLLATQPNGSNFIMSINGEWGSGKSSCVNMIKDILSNEYKDKVIYEDFEPWFFNGNIEALLKDFLSVLLKSTSTVFDDMKQGVNYLYEELNTLLRCLSFDIKLKDCFLNLGEINSKIDFCKLPQSKETTILELKSKIEQKLILSSKKIVIFIDDLDRSNKSEILQIFSLIKAVANFPNIIYVLSCDKNVLCDILEIEQGIAGDKYLDKIIQLSIDLPFPETNLLTDFLFDGINFEDHNNDFDLIRTYYNNGIKQVLNTPRKIKKFRKNFDVFYEKLKDDVCSADYFALTFLRIYAPRAYKIITDNIDWLSMRTTPEMLYYSVANVKQTGLYSKTMSLIDTLCKENSNVSHNSWKQFIAQMFPNINDILKENKPQSYASLLNQKKKRIFCAEISHSYFKFNYYNTPITKKQLSSMLIDINKYGDFSKYIQQRLFKNKFDENTLAFRYLKAISFVYSDEIPGDKLKIIVHDILNDGFKYDIENDSINGFFEQETCSYFSKQIVYNFLNTLGDLTARTNFLLENIEKIDLAFLCYFIRIDESFLEPCRIVEFKEKLLRKIEYSKKDILKTKNFKYIIFEYLSINPDKFDCFIDAIVKTDSDRISILKEVCPKNLGGMWHTNSIYKSLTIENMLNKIDLKNLTTSEKGILEHFKHIKEQLKD